MSDEYDQENQQSGGEQYLNSNENSTYKENYNEQAKTETPQEEETEFNETHGYRNETDDGRNDIDIITPAKVSLQEEAKQDEFIDKDSGIDPDSKKYINKFPEVDDSPEQVIISETNTSKTTNLTKKLNDDDDYDNVFNETSSVIIEPKRIDSEPKRRESAPKIENNGISVTPKPTTTKMTNGSVTDSELKESLDFLRKAPDLNRMNSDFLNSLMDSYLDKEYVNRAPTLKKPTLSPKTSTASTSAASPSPGSRKTSSSSTNNEIAKMEDLERNLKLIREKNQKQPPPPVRNKPPSVSKSWEDPREQQRLKVKEKQWPPKEPPKDVGAYVVESYGRTDPYTKKLIKDVQRNKRQEEERKDAEKRSTIVSDNTAPVKTLRDTFTTNPQKSSLGTLRPQTELHSERSWIRHEKKPIVYEEAPEEPDWMQLIRTRRWKSTVKAR